MQHGLARLASGIIATPHSVKAMDKSPLDTLVTLPAVYAVRVFLLMISHHTRWPAHSRARQHRSSPSVCRILVMADSVHTRERPLSE